MPYLIIARVHFIAAAISLHIQCNGCLHLHVECHTPGSFVYYAFKNNAKESLQSRQNVEEMSALFAYVVQVLRFLVARHVVARENKIQI